MADYFSLGNYYVAKKLGFLLAVLPCVLPVCISISSTRHPPYLLTLPLVVNTHMAGYPGKGGPSRQGRTGSTRGR